MEPNDNIHNNNMSEPRPVRAPGFANGSAAGGDTSGGVMPVSGGNDAVFQDKPKKNHGMLYGMILLAILAAGGIGFGVWAMMDGNSRAQKKDEQISQLQSQLAEKSEVVVDNDTTVVDVDDGDGDGDGDGATNTSVANTAGYIYVGEWGIKIRIPDGLKDKIGYIFSDRNYLDVTDFGIGYTYGQEVDWNSGNVLKIFRSEAGTIDFENCMVSCSRLITTLGGYDYSYMMQGSNLELLKNTLLSEMTKKEAFSEF